MAIVASCGGEGSKATIGAVPPSTIVLRASSTTARAGSPSISVIGGTLVPTTVVQPHVLPPGHVAHAILVAEAIKASGVGCDTASLDHPQATPEVPGGQLLESVSCDVGDDSVAITLSPSPTIDLSLQRIGACFVNRTHPGNLSYVKGTNWVVAPEHASTAQLISGRLHVRVESFHC